MTFDFLAVTKNISVSFWQFLCLHSNT